MLKYKPSNHLKKYIIRNEDKIKDLYQTKDRKCYGANDNDVFVYDLRPYSMILIVD